MELKMKGELRKGVTSAHELDKWIKHQNCGWTSINELQLTISYTVHLCKKYYLSEREHSLFLFFKLPVWICEK